MIVVVIIFVYYHLKKKTKKDYVIMFELRLSVVMLYTFSHHGELLHISGAVRN